MYAKLARVRALFSISPLYFFNFFSFFLFSSVYLTGYLFHASGPFRNNWVRGMPPPGEPVVAQTFDPRGDWGTSRHGVSRAVPGSGMSCVCA